METEVWPNICAQCRARRVPLVLANARLSAKSLRAARRARAAVAPAVRRARPRAAQTEDDAQRLRAAGARARRRCVGNLKFDMTPDAGAGGAGPRLARSAARARW